MEAESAGKTTSAEESHQASCSMLHLEANSAGMLPYLAVTGSPDDVGSNENRW